MVFILRQGTLVVRHPPVAPFYTRVCRLSTPGCKGWQHGGVHEIMCLFLLKKEMAFLKWRAVFRRFNTYYICFYICLFDYSICFFRGKNDNILVFNHMIKTQCFRSDRGVIEENVLYHYLQRLNINSYSFRSDRVIEDLQKTSHVDHNLRIFWLSW